ncbi:hypothetical protein MMC13_005020 [Lambiella insularis]|nr:hypothetical protein [Lambiella insularis]
MARAKQLLAPTPTTPLSLDATPSTFDGSLELFAFQPPSSISPRRPNGQSIGPGPKSYISNKRKPTEKMLHSATKRITRASTQAAAPPSIDLERQTTIPLPNPSKRKRASSSYAPPSKYSHLTNLLTDSLAPSLICVFIGVNPGIRTATLGHAYAHPSNLFWKLLHSSGCTDRRCLPSEDRDLPQLYALGHTNIVTRPTKDAGELSKAEMDAGVAVLEQKMGVYRPEAVCLVGKSIWESVWRATRGRAMRKEEFRWGWQEQRIGAQEGYDGARIFVATSTSGLAVSPSRPEKEEIWRELGEWVQRKRTERNTVGETDGERR